MTRPGARLPKAPVLDWRDLVPSRGNILPSVGDLPNRALTTSGRAALLAALQQMDLPAGSAVLVPSYHCPTMVAPIVQAGLQPVYYPIEPGGLPALDRIDETISDVRAMFVAHYFGLPLSLGRVLAWCRARDITLVEDCAHTFFGMAGERPVGQWGDYAAASLSKFYPLPEGGLLASQTRTLRPLGLQRQPLRSQLKAAWDVFDLAQSHDRLGGLRQLLAPMARLRHGQGHALEATLQAEESPPTPDAIRAGCDMGRVGLEATWASRVLYRALPASHIVARRRDNYRQYTYLLADTAGAQALRPTLPEQAAPYVFPLWIDGPARADAVYNRLRLAHMPVFRWDRHWPGTPLLPEDAGTLWSRQVLQLLCHQALRPQDIELFVERIHAALAPGHGSAR